ncbi:hypothetical protein G7Y89_g15758 [Cudoniella acicularis]|uniref:Uncharacterized protein n=1 Tax=Cudoniella acicularis TaxID=354080 RepID=A0A8H4VI72_9HELO|nr:hypothetical protein G7Y89_g15758 [Cudoniella acicularis]
MAPKSSVTTPLLSQLHLLGSAFSSYSHPACVAQLDRTCRTQLVKQHCSTPAASIGTIGTTNFPELPGLKTETQKALARDKTMLDLALSHLAKSQLARLSNFLLALFPHIPHVKVSQLPENPAADGNAGKPTTVGLSGKHLAVDHSPSGRGRP